MDLLLAADTHFKTLKFKFPQSLKWRPLKGFHMWKPGLAFPRATGSPTRKGKRREVCLTHRLPYNKGKLTRLVSVKRTNSNYYDVVTKKFAFTIPVFKKTTTNKHAFWRLLSVIKHQRLMINDRIFPEKWKENILSLCKLQRSKEVI